MLAYIYLHTHTRSCRRESDNDRDIRPCLLPLILRVHKHTHASRGASFIALPGALPLHTHTYIHTSSCVLEIRLMMIHTPMPTLDGFHKHIFLFHVYRSVFLARMRRYTQLAYLFHQCATSLRRDGRIADCTARHPGV